jgi:pimeloyl-ACP methyl ester carboxylesterase
MTEELNIVLVHGAFADGSHWRHIIPRLYQAWHRVMAAQNPLTSLADDIANTRKLAEWMGGPTLLVGHSYGGAVITGAGRATNVVGLVYLAAFAPAQGESVNSINLASSDPAPGWASISPAFDDDFLWHRQDTFHDAFCQDLDDTESLVMATTQRPLARRCLDDVTGEPAWKTKPSWYQVSAHDRMIPPTERWMAERIHARETIELDTSHASFATWPTQVLELITNAASAI